jgi:hypothetical protein
MKNLFKSEKSSLLYVFAFFDGLAVASGALFGYFFPKLVSDIFGANFSSNDLIWFQFVLLPGFAINVIYMYFAISKNRRGILLSNILRTITTIGFFLMWGDAIILRSLLNLMIMHHIFFISITGVLFFKKNKNNTTEISTNKDFLQEN